MAEDKVLSFPENDISRRAERVKDNLLLWLLSDDCPLNICYCCLEKMDLQEFRDALAYGIWLKEQTAANMPKFPKK